MDNKDNVLVGRQIRKMFPANLIFLSVTSISFLVDSMLAGFFLTKEAVAAIGLALPLYGLFFALVLVIAKGMSIILAQSLGKGDKAQCNSCYTTSMIGNIIISGIGIVLALVVGEGLVASVAGNEPALIDFANIYLRLLMCSLPFAGMTFIFGLIFAVYGHPNYSFIIHVVSIVTNICISVSLCIFAPQLGIAALGYGTIISSIIATVTAFALLKIEKNIGLQFLLATCKIKIFGRMMKLGLPSCLDSLLSSVCLSIVNSYILKYLGSDGLSYSTMVENIATVLICCPRGACSASEPLFGIFYAVHEVKGVSKTWKEGLKYIIIYQIFWSILVICLIPFVIDKISNSGISSAEIIWMGVIISVVGSFLSGVVNLIVTAFESMDRFFVATSYAVIGDSILYTLLAPFFISKFGYFGLFSGKYICFAILLAGSYLIHAIAGKNMRVSTERYLMIQKSEQEQAPIFDMSISMNEDAIVSVAEKIQDFMAEHKVSGKVAYVTALSTEEIAVDMVNHYDTYHKSKSKKVKKEDYLDIKLSVLDGEVALVIRSDGRPYNPLDFVLDTDDFGKTGVLMIQKLAKNIEYNYVYGMNVITIKVATNG